MPNTISRGLVALLSVSACLSGCRVETHEHTNNWYGPHLFARAIASNFMGGDGESYDVVDTNFRASFTANVPQPGYVFSHWRVAPRGLCGGSTNPICAFNTSIFENNQSILAYLVTSDDVYHVHPIAKRSTCSKSLFDQDANGQVRLCAGIDYGSFNVEEESIDELHIDAGVTLRNSDIYADKVFINGGVTLVDTVLEMYTVEGSIDGLTMRGNSRLFYGQPICDRSGGGCRITDMQYTNSTAPRDGLKLQNITLHDSSVIAVSDTDSTSDGVQFVNVDFAGACTAALTFTENEVGWLNVKVRGKPRDQVLTCESLARTVGVLEAGDPCIYDFGYVSINQSIPAHLSQTGTVGKVLRGFDGACPNPPRDSSI